MWVSLCVRVYVCGYSCTVDNRLDGVIISYGSDLVVYCICCSINWDLSDQATFSTLLPVCRFALKRLWHVPLPTTVMNCYVHTCGYLLSLHKNTRNVAISAKLEPTIIYHFLKPRVFPILTFSQTVSKCLDSLCVFYMLSLFTCDSLSGGLSCLCK